MENENVVNNDQQVVDQKQEVEQDSTKEETSKKTYTEEEVKNLLSAKNHEKEARKSLQAELDDLKAKYAKLSGEEAVEKFNQEKFNQLQQKFDELEEKNQKLIQQAEDNEFKDALRGFKGLLPEAVDDVLNKAKNRGFRKTEVGYIDANGKTVEDFIADLKKSNSYYFGLSSNHNLADQKFQEKIQAAKKTKNTLAVFQAGLQGYNLKDLAQ